MAYAIIETGGKQFRVKEGDLIGVPSLPAEIGESVKFKALARGEGDRVQIGTPALEAPVQATVVEHGRGDKVIVFKKKRRKRYKKIHGHRQGFTAVLIDSIGD